jgi:hypothetical protein
MEFGEDTIDASGSIWRRAGALCETLLDGRNDEARLSLGRFTSAS